MCQVELVCPGKIFAVQGVIGSSKPIDLLVAVTHQNDFTVLLKHDAAGHRIRILSLVKQDGSVPARQIWHSQLVLLEVAVMHSREWIFWVGHLAPDELGPLDNLGNILGLLRRKNLAGIGPSEVGVEDAEVSAGHECVQGI